MKGTGVLLLSLWIVISTVEAQRRRIALNCWWFSRNERVYCVLARLDLFLSNLEVPASAREVVCTNSALHNATMFKKQVLERTGELEILKLPYNNLRVLPFDFLQANPMLKEINLRSNKLKDIPANIFKRQTRLETLDVSNNYLTNIAETTFRYNPYLNVLQLWNNQLETLPEDLFRRLSNLKKLSLTNNALVTLPGNLFETTRSLRQLHIVRNKLKCLPTRVFNGLVNIETINLGLNDLRNIPDGLLSTTRNLRSIRLWANRIECIPKTLFDNTSNLEFANFLLRNIGMPWRLRQRFSNFQSYNTINELRRKLMKFGNNSCANYRCDWDPEAARLDCSYRNLSSIDQVDDVCGEVRHLQLNGNQFDNSSEIGALLKRHPQIRTLELQDNMMEGELNGEMLKGAEFLSFLDLSSNDISELPQDLFENNLLLQEVRMQRNSITTIPAELFKVNDAMEKLDFSSNRIRKLPEKVFERNSALQDVDFSLNHIQHLDAKQFEKNIKLRLVDFSDNALSGTADLSSLRNAKDLLKLQLQGNKLREVTFDVINQSNSISQNQTKEILLSSNRLRQVPVALLLSVPLAEKFDFKKNEIAYLPQNAFSKNFELLSIDLSNNRIHSISTTTFQNNQNLQELILDGNSLTELSAQLLYNNRNLKVFSAAGNRLKSIPVNLFWRNPHLKEVRLSNNQLGRTGLPGNLFAGSPRLNFVSLGGNSLKTLPEALFQGTPQLTQVYLQKNNLESIARNTFQVRESLSDQSLLGIVAGINETDSEKLEELLDENISQNKYTKQLLSGIIKLDLRDNPPLKGAGMGNLFTAPNVTDFFNLLFNIS